MPHTYQCIDVTFLRKLGGEACVLKCLTKGDRDRQNERYSAYVFEKNIYVLGLKLPLLLTPSMRNASQLP